MHKFCIHNSSGRTDDELISSENINYVQDQGWEPVAVFIHPGPEVSLAHLVFPSCK